MSLLVDFPSQKQNEFSLQDDDTWAPDGDHHVAVFNVSNDVDHIGVPNQSLLAHPGPHNASYTVRRSVDGSYTVKKVSRRASGPETMQMHTEKVSLVLSSFS